MIQGTDETLRKVTKWVSTSCEGVTDRDKNTRDGAGRYGCNEQIFHLVERGHPRATQGVAAEASDVETIWTRI